MLEQQQRDKARVSRLEFVVDLPCYDNAVHLSAVGREVLADPPHGARVAVDLVGAPRREKLNEHQLLRILNGNLTTISPSLVFSFRNFTAGARLRSRHLRELFFAWILGAAYQQ